MVYLKIKEIRERINISKEYISVQMDISIKKYNEIETGKVDLKISKLKELSNIFGVSESDFFY